MRKTNTDQPGHPEDVQVQEFLDMIAPSVVKFNTDHFICGNTFRCVWALREYPTSTEKQTILKRLGEKDGVTLRIYTRHVKRGRGTEDHQQCRQQEPDGEGQHQ